MSSIFDSLTPPSTISMQDSSVVVVGAGMVGVCVALDLQRRGAQVTLIDRHEPGRETSYGNAGVLARSSVLPLNNPGMLRDLPGLLGNQRTAFRYNWRYLSRNLNWALPFLANARQSRVDQTAAALDELIRLSIPAHKAMIADCGQDDLLSERGWIFLYRSDASFARGGMLRSILGRFEISSEALVADELRDLEPHLAPVFRNALWVKDSASIRDPGALVAAYAKRFVAKGGEFRMGSVVGLSLEGAPGVTVEGGEIVRATHCVLCPGPWGKDLLAHEGYQVPMAFERGYHRHFQGPDHLGNVPALGRPIYDTGGGYVLSPMRQGLRLTTGVELNSLAADPNHSQLNRAETAAREAIDLGARCSGPTWMGARPTFPDSRPCIGALPHAPGFSVAFGHQHIGFATGPGTARTLGDLLEGKTPPIDPAPFRPDRYISLN
ncbi:MAG: FAD-dependent oxidoreductase [Paracoccaceae bacterium]